MDKESRSRLAGRLPDNAEPPPGVEKPWQYRFYESLEFEKTILTTAALLVPANSRRVWCSVVNRSTNFCWLFLGNPNDKVVVPTASGLPLYSYGSFWIDANTPWYGEIWALSGAVQSILGVTDIFEMP